MLRTPHAALAACLAALLAAGCREPPSRQGGPAGEGAPQIASLTPPLTAADLSGDLTIAYVRTWATGRSVRVTLERKDGVIQQGRAHTVWRKSSLMQERTYVLVVDADRFEKLLSILRDAELPEIVEDDGDTAHCSIEVVTPARTFRAGGFCDALTGRLASVWQSLTGLLHPSYFISRHLLEAGQHAEARLNAKDVYFYYVDGSSMLGRTYGPVEGDHTGVQLEEAAQAHEQERYVDAVVAARNALATRLSLYEKRWMQGMDVELEVEPGR